MRMKTCLYKDYINCEYNKTCSTCGWNPAVEAARKRMLRLYGVNILAKENIPAQKREISDEERIERGMPISDRYARLYIKEHSEDFDGAMSRWQIQRHLHIGNNRYTRLENQLRNRKEA